MLVPAAVSSLATEFRAPSHRVVTSDTLPSTAGAWIGQPYPLSEQEEAALENPSACQKIYLGPHGQMVQVLLLQMDRTQNIHDPKLCMFGDGFQLQSDQVIPAPWSPGRNEAVRQAAFTKGNLCARMTYWLQTPEGASADIGAGLKASSLLGLLVGKSRSGIAVRVTSFSRPGDTGTDPSIQVWEHLAKATHFEQLARSTG